MDVRFVPVKVGLCAPPDQVRGLSVIMAVWAVRIANLSHLHPR